MSKALVRARGMATPEQFRTDWSQFMKQNIAMNLMLYPYDLSMDKSDAILLFKPALPKAMVDKFTGTETFYVCVAFKGDDNVYQATVFDIDVSELSVAQVIAGSDWMTTVDHKEFAITAAKVTALSVYDVIFVYSDQSITTEVVENVRDLPYVLEGKACEYHVNVTCVA